jgi:hypothetical protein
MTTALNRPTVERIASEFLEIIRDHHYSGRVGNFELLNAPAIAAATVLAPVPDTRAREFFLAALDQQIADFEQSDLLGSTRRSACNMGCLRICNVMVVIVKLQHAS